jgi:hypothetical protein
MGKLKKLESGEHTITLKTDGNPEGKGLDRFMRDRNQSMPRDVVAKPRRRLLSELFASMLVLSAEFKFRPVMGTATFLYWVNDAWSLSLIAPDEWSYERRDGFAGACVLQRDMTWKITPSDRLSEENPVSEAIGRFYDAFVEMLDTDLSLEEILPFYVGNLPYYQRLYASALSRSVYFSVLLGDQAATSCRSWNKLVSTDKRQDRQLQWLGAQT